MQKSCFCQICHRDTEVTEKQQIRMLSFFLINVVFDSYYMLCVLCVLCASVAIKYSG